MERLRRRRFARAVALLELCIVTPATLMLALTAFDFGNGVIARQRASAGAQQVAATAAAVGGVDVTCAHAGQPCADATFSAWQRTSGVRSSTLNMSGPDRCGAGERIIVANVEYTWRSVALSSLQPLLGVAGVSVNPIVQASTAAVATCEVRR